MNREEAIRYIRNENGIPGDQKSSLVEMLYKHPNNFLSIWTSMKSLIAFSSDTFEGLSSSERAGVVRGLVKGQEKKRPKSILEELLRVFFPDLPSFLELVLKRSRKEKGSRCRALMMELVIGFYKSPLKGSSLEDYLPGLFHREELFRCRILHFLYEHFKEEALTVILQRISEIKPPLSLLFYGTLGHFLSLHPETNWCDQIRKLMPNKAGVPFPERLTEGRGVLIQELRPPLERYSFLSMDMNEERSRSIPWKNPDQEPSETDHEGELTCIRLERFEKILSCSLKKTLFSGCSKMPGCKAPEILRSEAYLDVRRNDEG